MHVPALVRFSSNTTCEFVSLSFVICQSNSSESVASQIWDSTSYVRKKYCTFSGHDNSTPARLLLKVDRYCYMVAFVIMYSKKTISFASFMSSVTASSTRRLSNSNMRIRSSHDMLKFCS